MKNVEENSRHFPNHHYYNVIVININLNYLKLSEFFPRSLPHV
jgi:hypothetical protein